MLIKSQMVISLYFAGTSFTNIRADHPHWFLLNDAWRNFQVVTELTRTYTIYSLPLVPATISFVALVIIFTIMVPACVGENY